MNPQLEAFLQSEACLCDRVLLDTLIFSHRAVDCTPETFHDSVHTHAFCEVVVYLEGAVEYIAEHSLYAPRFGDIFIAAPGELHGAHLYAPSHYACYVLRFPADLLDGFVGGCEALACLGGERMHGQGNLLRPDAHDLSGMLALLREAEAENDLLAWSAILRFFHLLGRLWADRAPSAIPPMSLSEPLEAALAIIAADYAAIRSVTEIADRVHVSTEHLSRLFSRRFGVPISVYLRHHRLGESKRLLLSGASVTEACYAVGFSNISHFIRCFRVHIGMTPARYAKELKK